MIGKMIAAAVLGLLLAASSVTAQEGRWQEISVQGTGFFTKDSSDDGINQHATDIGGFLLSYQALHASRRIPGLRLPTARL